MSTNVPGFVTARDGIKLSCIKKNSKVNLQVRRGHPLLLQTTHNTYNFSNEENNRLSLSTLLRRRLKLDYRGP
jgi:hypothetical protein